MTHRLPSYLAAVGLLLAGPAAHAGLIVSSARSAYDATFDKVQFTLTGYTGIDQTTPNTVVSLVEGTWSALGTAAVISTPATGGTAAARASSFRSNTTNLSFDTPPKSFVNFDTANAGAFTERDGAAFTVPAGTATSTSFSGGWFTTDPAGKLAPSTTDLSNLVAEFFITKGAGLSFSGVYGSTAQNDTQALSFSIAAVPEPTTVGLVAASCLGLLARRRRA